MYQDELMLARWKLNGVIKVLDILQTSETTSEYEDLFFILSNELQEAI